MYRIIAKVTKEDGTESSFGPVEISHGKADSIVKVLEPLEQARLEAEAAARLQTLVEAQAARSLEAETSNQARIALASEGIDPDAPREER